MQTREEAELALARSVKRAKIWSTVLFVLTLVLILAGVLIVRDWLRCTSFSAEHWRDAPQERGAMLHDLLQEHNLYACSQKQVLELLGPPDVLRDTVAGYRLREGQYLWFQFDGGTVRQISIKTAPESGAVFI